MSDAMLYTPEGCVLYLDLRKPVNGKLLDYSGHGNHGVIYGARLNMELPCRGLEFDGKDDYVKVPYDSILKPNKYVAIEILFELRDVRLHGLFGEYYGHRVQTSSDNRLYCGVCLSDDNWYRMTGRYLDVGRVYHVVYVRDGTLIAQYVNGELDASMEVPDLDTVYGSLAWCVGAVTGRNVDYAEYYFSNSWICLVRLYNRALSAEEVKKCYEDIQMRILRRIVATRDVSVR